jgi:predicted RNA-binding Zn-ribbon protein involved in translation (DUF1610 family)
MKPRPRRQPFYQMPKTATGVPVQLKSTDPLKPGATASLFVCPTCDADEWLCWKMNKSQAVYLQCAKCSTIVQLSGPPAEPAPEDFPDQNAPGITITETVAQEPAQEPAQAPGAAELAQEPPTAQIAAEPYQEPAQEPSGKKGKKSWREDR